MSRTQPEEGEIGGGASQTTEPAAGSSTGTDVSLRDYFFALRQADERLRQADLMFAAERDRRYTEVDKANDRRLAEVATEREKALAIKEEADKAALGLAREIQTYKDEKANELREQIAAERGEYLTRTEYIAQHEALEATVATLADSVREQLKPITEYIAGRQGRTEGGVDLRAWAGFAILVLFASQAIILWITR